MREYLTGTAWAGYSTSQTVNGTPLSAGLKCRQRLPTSLWTPSTKVEIGDRDEIITKEEADRIVGEKVGRRIE